MIPLWDDEPRRRAPVVTTAIIAANIAVFLYEVLLAGEGRRTISSWLYEYALVPERLLAHLDDLRQWRTVLTSMFLHGGVTHVLGNCWFLWVFGRAVEARLGSARYLLFYLLCGCGAAALQVATNLESAIPMLGASGAISGVLGAYFVLLPFAWVYTLVPWFVPIIPIPAFFFLVVWFVIQALNGVGTLASGQAAAGGVAWWAHAGGFISGIVLISLARKAHWVRRG